jgi:mannose-1-phosphate guanylyltransferase
VSAHVSQAVLLVGGEGRRLRPLTDTRPKPMMALVDRPFVSHQLDHLRRHGITDVIFSCGYRPEALEAHFGDGSAFGMRLSYVVDPEPLGTAGAVKNAEGLLTGDRVLVFNGDILTDLDLDALAAQHLDRGSVGTIALTPVEEPWAYGLVRLHPDRAVEAFLEKPTPDQLRPGEPFLINAGTYLLDRAVVERMPAGRKCSIEREVFPEEAARGALYGFPNECYWRDIGTPASYRQAHLDVLSGAVRTESPTGDRYLGPGASVADGASVGPLATLGPDAVVEAEASVERSVVGAGARIGRGAALADAIVGAGATIGEGAVLADGVVIGDEAVIGAGNRLRGALKVATGATIAAGTLID